MFRFIEVTESKVVNAAEILDAEYNPKHSGTGKPVLGIKLRSPGNGFVVIHSPYAERAWEAIRANTIGVEPS